MWALTSHDYPNRHDGIEAGERHEEATIGVIVHTRQVNTDEKQHVNKRLRTGHITQAHS